MPMISIRTATDPRCWQAFHSATTIAPLGSTPSVASLPAPGGGVIVACSARKASYRAELREHQLAICSRIFPLSKSPLRDVSKLAQITLFPSR